MLNMDAAKELFRYSDWANGQLIMAAAPLSDDKLDTPVEMGPGSLRRTLMHLWAGEHVWLQRWQRRTETAWPDEAERLSPKEIGERLSKVSGIRAAFIDSVKPESLGREITYRDSKGDLFTATLSDMLIQGILHSVHHRAQAVNMIRRAGGISVDLDYMYWIRKPTGK
ncbi:MAG: DinB family protein [Phycisphaerae bacterium]|nr:DinB family protein [Phycisphaerae bacterium]